MAGFFLSVCFKVHLCVACSSTVLMPTSTHCVAGAFVCLYLNFFCVPVSSSAKWGISGEKTEERLMVALLVTSVYVCLQSPSGSVLPNSVQSGGIVGLPACMDDSAWRDDSELWVSANPCCHQLMGCSASVPACPHLYNKNISPILWNDFHK